MFAGTSYAEETSENTESEATESEENPNEMICRRVHVTGTRLPRRHCMKRSEWADMREQARETMEQNTMDSNQMTTGGN